MKDNYSFLKDDLAVLEIRKHKWVESQKQGQEVGFATAAVDWIKKYGDTFKQFRLSRTTAQDPLAEKRLYRRFPQKFPLRVATNNRTFSCHTDDINLIGLSCTVSELLPDNAVADVSIQFKSKGSLRSGPKFDFQTRVSKVTNKSQRHFKTSYRVFLPFSEEVRDYLRTQAKILS